MQYLALALVPAAAVVWLIMKIKSQMNLPIPIQILCGRHRKKTVKMVAVIAVRHRVVIRVHRVSQIIISRNRASSSRRRLIKYSSSSNNNNNSRNNIRRSNRNSCHSNNSRCSSSSNNKMLMAIRQIRRMHHRMPMQHLMRIILRPVILLYSVQIWSTIGQPFGKWTRNAFYKNMSHSVRMAKCSIAICRWYVNNLIQNRNITKFMVILILQYSSWNLDSKKLYVKAPVRIQVQSHKETIVEFMRSELLADDTEQFIEKIMEDYLRYRDNFEIYIQTMISQVLDPSFFLEITREKDEYFLGSVRIIDSIMDNCKRKLLSITPWTRSIIVSIETYPKCHVFTEWGQNNLTQRIVVAVISQVFLCVSCFSVIHIMRTLCNRCRLIRVWHVRRTYCCVAYVLHVLIFHKIAHEKYNLYIQCSSRVAEQQQECPGKSSTEILNDLLAEHNWVDELFRNMRNSWAEVESLERQKRFREVSQ
ncbi:unnamed protein product [Ceratitis capitata]|uniref:(Mediterranean fruit fly) hypothetical protein n=1 Tax=Ceratitis capitata TaxID=7213 RepID=A0A811V3H6_CERCA|nr:unnamed protein product [Ceratitis capitata]